MPLTFNQVCQPTFTTPIGQEATFIGAEMDNKVPSVWRNRKEYFAWIVSARIGENLIDIKFNINQEFTGVKYCHEDENKYRKRL